MRRRLFALAAGLLTAVAAGVVSADECCPPGPRCAPTLMTWSCCPVEPREPGPLVTDRPDFTEASSTVGLGTYQFEMGYTYAFDDDGLARVSAQSYPEVLFRAGILRDWFELRLGWTLLEETTRAAGLRNTNVGSSDLYVGAKIGLTPQCGVLPEMALIPQMFVPIGDDAFSAEEVLPGLNWIYGWEITDCISTAGSTQGNRVVDSNDESFLVMAQSWTIAYTLTERVGGYTEWFALFPHSASDDTKPLHFFNGGFTWLLNDNLQYDVRAGVGLNDAAEDYFVGTGLSVKF